MDKRPDKETGERIAIIIGCASYESQGLNDLQYAEKDARAIENRLRNPEIGGFGKIHTFDSSSTLKEIELTTDQVLAATHSEDKVVIYFSGHGIKHQQNGQLYLAIHETVKQSPRHTAISANELLEQLEDARAARKCVILDCCYSGAFGRKSGSVEMLDFEQDLKPHEGRGVVVLASSKEYEESLESDRHEHSLFTHYLLEGMDGAADGDNDGVITPSELYQYAFQRVHDEADGKMSPKVPLNRLDGPEFYLVQNPRKEQEKLEQWKYEIEKLQSQNDHLSALEQLQQSIDKYDDQPAPIVRKLILFQQQVEKDICRKWRNYLARLNTDWSEDLISRELKELAELYVSVDPEFMFSGKLPNDPLSLDLRQHFNTDISSEALNKRWPRTRLAQLTKPAAVIPTDEIVKDDIEDSDSYFTVKDGKEDIKPDESINNVTQDAISDSIVKGDIKEIDPVVTEKKIPVEESFLKHLKRWAPFITGICIILLVVYFMPSTRTFDPENIKLGINARSSSGDQSSTYILSEFRKELNRTLKEKSSGFQLTEHITQFENTGNSYKAISDSLNNGEIDILGELSPREIFKLNEDVGLTPFIGPKHSVRQGSPAQSTYQTVLFGLAKYYSGPKSQRTDKLISEIETGKKIVVANKDSTSGYWWPRFWVLDRLQDKEIEISFDSSSVIQKSSVDIIKKVICDPNKMTAGALAEFRFRKHVDEYGQLRGNSLLKEIKDCGAASTAKLLEIEVLDEIPNGAYVLGPEAAKQPLLVNALNDAWEPAIGRLLGRAYLCKIASENCTLKLSTGTPITPDKIKRYLPENWLPRNLDTYTGGFAGQVFSFEDPKAKQQYRIIFGLLLICAVILVLGLTAATLLRRSRTTEQQSES